MSLSSIPTVREREASTDTVRTFSRSSSLKIVVGGSNCSHLPSSPHRATTMVGTTTAVGFVKPIAKSLLSGVTATHSPLSSPRSPASSRNVVNVPMTAFPRRRPGSPTWASSGDVDSSGINSLFPRGDSERLTGSSGRGGAGAGDGVSSAAPSYHSQYSKHGSTMCMGKVGVIHGVIDGPLPSMKTIKSGGSVPRSPAADDPLSGGTTKKAAPEKKKKVQPSCCTIPIAACFAIACVVIAIVLAVTTAFPMVLFTVQINDGIKDTLAAGLEGAMMIVRDTLGESAAAARQFKLMIESNPERYACDDGFVRTFPGNASNAGFFHEAGMYAMQRPVIRSLYQTRLSKRYFYPNGSPVIIMCLVDPYATRLYYFANSTISAGTYNGSGVVLGNIIKMISSNSTPAYNLQNSSFARSPLQGTGPRWVASAQLAQFDDGAPKFSFYLSITDPTDPTAKWSIAFDHSMAAVKNVLLQGTPPVDLTGTPSQYEGAHTTMYDTVNHVLVTSTHAGVPVLQSNKQLWPAGQSPVEEVNDAYNRAVVMCKNESCARAVVVIDDDHIRTSYNVVDSASNLHLLLVSVVPRRYFFAESERVFTITILLSVSCCVALIAGSIVFLVLMHRPLASLKRNMMMAAELHNDRVEHTPTYLRDIANLSSVFDGMNQQLLIARSFVPEAVLLGKTEDSQEADDDDEGSVANQTVHSHLTGNQVRSLKHSHSTIDGTKATHTTVSSGGMAKLFTIAEKRVAVLSLNLLGFHALCAPDRQGGRAQRINEVSTALLTMAVACAHSERGVMDSFHGDHFVLTFNASRAVAGPLAAAVRTANTFIQIVRSDPQLCGCFVAAGAASGKAQVGTFGIDGYRRMSVVGDAYRNATALQLAAVQFLRMNSHAGLDSGCLVDETALKELGSCPFHLQIVGCIQSSSTRVLSSEKPRRTAYFAFDASTNQMQDEWLYELNAMEATDPYTVPNRAMIALMGGSVNECRDIVENNRRREGKRSSLSTSIDVVSANQGVDKPEWSVVQHHLDTYVLELERIRTSSEDAVAVHSKRMGLTWVAFQQ